MAEQTNVPAERKVRPIDVFRKNVQTMETEFKRALMGTTVPVEKFIRVVMTAVQNNPDILKCDQRSILNAATRAAQDGLLPDGREGAIVPFGDQAQWMPMVQGILKKVYASGEVASITTMVVHRGEAFDHWVDDVGEHLTWRRQDLESFDDDAPPVLAFAMAVMRDGGKMIEVMSARQIEKVKGVSRAANAKNGPWSVWPEEMWRKTVLRRLAKRLPYSLVESSAIGSDDELFMPGETNGAADRAKPVNTETQAARQLPQGSNALDQFAADAEPEREKEPAQQAQPTEEKPARQRKAKEAAPAQAAGDPRDGAGQTIDHDAETGEVVDNQPQPREERRQEPAAAEASAGIEKAGVDEADEAGMDIGGAKALGAMACRNRRPRRPPEEFREGGRHAAFADAWRTGWDEEEAQRTQRRDQ